MIVTHFLGDCPGCKGVNTFGNVSVGKMRVLRGCTACNYRQHVDLPQIHKKILYLDQFFFSAAFRDKDQRFVGAANRISELASKQVLSIPYSSIHEDETHLWRGFDGKNKEDLMEFIKSTSRGHEFEPAWEVEQTQLNKAFQSYQRGDPCEFVLDQNDVLKDDIHVWDDYFWIDVGRYIGDIDLNRKYKNEALDALLNAIEVWRNATNSFEQDLAVEINAAAKGYLDSYFTYISRIASGDFAALLNAPMISSVVRTLLHFVPVETDELDKIKLLVDFFKSDHFANVPRIWISSRTYSVLRKIIQGGAYTNRQNSERKLSGFFKDVEHVSTYAPYCDAIVIDQPMAAIVNDGRLSLQTKYPVRVFTLNNWKEFMDWLDGIEASITDDHANALKEAYPWMQIV